ncbi:hypothetical protein V2I01_31365 [Micromonospora sp. BRA006-A]|nr:hypothetical protein [Micromonospora sp. BRA006-A]
MLEEYRPRVAEAATVDGGQADGSGAVEPARRPGLVASDVTLWPVSARSRTALGGQAARLADFLRRRGEIDPAAVGWSLATTRSTFDHRAAVVGSTADELLAGLDALAAGQPAGNSSPVRSPAPAQVPSSCSRVRGRSRRGWRPGSSVVRRCSTRSWPSAGGPWRRTSTWTSSRC